MSLKRWIFAQAALACLLVGGGGHAATMAVTANAPDVVAVDGTCSLREAISAANNNAAHADCPASGAFGDDIITLPAGTYTTAGPASCEDGNANGDYDILIASPQTLTINGAGAASTIIDGGDFDRVFDLINATASPTVTINGVTIRNGTARFTTAGCPAGADGGGIRVNAQSTLNLNDSIVTSNEGQGGGGIFNNGTLNVQDSTVSSNNAADDGGGIFNADSGIETFLRTTISGNTSAFSGGGIYDNHDPSGVTETTLIVESTISGNDADEGGGLYADANTTDSVITLINATVSGNTSAADGGGVYVCYGTVNLRNATVTGNTAADDGGGVALPSCGESEMNVRNTIIAANIDSSSATSNPDCFRENPSDLFTEGFNLIGNETGCDGLFAGSGDQAGTSATPINPRLGPLADNGGPTLTHALLTAPTVSPAIDTANSAGCFSNDANNGSLLTTDQRGSPRPQDGGPAGPTPARCDIGAFELGACGDGFVGGSEACDDGNLAGGDGCSDVCEIEACANGTVDVGEECDDGNSADGDGCSANCTNEIPPACGDDVLQSGEECDDGNATDGDGCSANCDLEAACGDGALDAGEGCDDGNTVAGDGCSATCTVEPALVVLLGDGGCSLIR
ncbi:MAG TPA: DUF4215 domain-containing protein [bacterium]|nr:DUF4215 domain-containing protein [bacterium]